MTATLTKPQIMRAIRVRTINKGKEAEQVVRLIFQLSGARDITVSFSHHLPHNTITLPEPPSRDVFEAYVRAYMLRASDQALTLARRAAVRRHLPRSEEKW